MSLSIARTPARQLAEAQLTHESALQQGLWAVCRTRSGHELDVWQLLEDLGFTAYTPMETRFTRAGNRRHWRRYTSPAFPGYLFARGLPSHQRLEKCYGWLGFIITCGRPAMVPRGEVERVRDICDEGGFDRGARDVQVPFKKGDWVTVVQEINPLCGRRGRIQEIVKNGRWAWVDDGAFPHRTLVRTFDLAGEKEF